MKKGEIKMKHKNLKVKCDKCGYNKAMVIDMSQPDAEQLVHLQENKKCPNCGSEQSLHFVEK